MVVALVYKIITLKVRQRETNIFASGTVLSTISLTSLMRTIEAPSTTFGKFARKKWMNQVEV